MLLDLLGYNLKTRVNYLQNEKVAGIRDLLTMLNHNLL